MSGIDKEIEGFFEDPDASSAVISVARQITAPVVGTPLTIQETGTGGGIRVVYLGLDRSGSMHKVGDELRRSFNVDFVPAIRAAREDDVSALRVGGLAFSTNITPIWVSGGISFHSLDELPQLTTSEYDPDWYGSTALYQAILTSSANAMRYASEVQLQMGIDVEVDIITLTDGANNEPPYGIDGERQVFRLVRGSKTSRVRYSYLYFETEYGMGDPKEHAIHQLGYDPEQVETFMMKPDETPEERAHRFRRLIQVISRVSASRGTSVVQATQAVLDDEELV